MGIKGSRSLVKKINTISAATDTEIAAILAAVDTEIASILEDTGTTIPATLGTPTDTDLATDITNVKTEVDKIGTPADTDVSTDIANIKAIADATERCVEKSDGAVLTGADDLFTVTGGPVVAKIVGIVTTEIGGASNGKLQITTDEPAATVDLNAGAVAIDTDAAGTSYRNVGATSVFTPVTAGVVIVDPVTVQDTEFLLPIGTVKFDSTAAQTGNIKWYIIYKPLSPNSVVTAAA